MLKGKHRIRLRLPDMPRERPQKFQKSERVSGSARSAIKRIGRLLERLGFAKEKKVPDLEAAR
jgi:hypothetical protein